MKNRGKNFLALFFGLIIALLLAESIIRLFPDKFTQYLKDSSELTFKYQKDERLGYLCRPNQQTIWDTPAVKISPIFTNSLGFRGGEWNRQAAFKLAILGDSHLLALTVSESDHTAAILNALLHQEVLNTGVGGYGTIAELFAYKKFLSPLKPEITILFFSANDIIDNSRALAKSGASTHRVYQPSGYLLDGEVKIDTAYDSRRRQESRIRRILKKYFLSLVVLYRMIVQSSAADKVEWEVYVPAKEGAWQDAWRITEEILVDLKREIEADGGTFIVVPFPDNIITFRNWQEEFKQGAKLDKIPEGFDPYYPQNRLEAISRSQGIIFFNPAPYLLEYRDKFNLAKPYFAYRGDGHWNPLGHFLIANIVARYLLQADLLPVQQQQKQDLLKKINGHLRLSPLQILGGEAYRQIYRRGKYLGSSNISKILD